MQPHIRIAAFVSASPLHGEMRYASEEAFSYVYHRAYELGFDICNVDVYKALDLLRKTPQLDVIRCIDSIIITGRVLFVPAVPPDHTAELRLIKKDRALNALVVSALERNNHTKEGFRRLSSYLKGLSQPEKNSTIKSALIRMASDYEQHSLKV